MQQKTWKIVNEIAGSSYSNPASKVKTPNGKVIKSSKELLSEWKKYFSNLLNAAPATQTRNIPPAENDLPIVTGDFTLEEIQKAIQTLNNYKAPGVDFSITAEAIKYGGEELTNKLLTLTNLVKHNKIPPKQWRLNLIIPLPKKGDISIMNNFRGISLMSIAGKLFNRLLLNRIREPTENN